ncbi:MAG: MBL fold metallo-hydrolase [Acidimicrobiia bacterium]|nr:MBL fold metallo-hydrolase [Acidimicrobiia bacterium]
MMSEHPLSLSTRMIDSGVADTPPNRITHELSELADGVAVVESFSHVIAIDSGDGLVLFDTSSAPTGKAVAASLRRWSDEPVNTIVFTHGHLDHVGGSRVFAAEAAERSRPRPRVIGQARIPARFERYQATSGYNQTINLRQFGGAAAAERRDKPFLPPGTLWPDVVYEDELREQIGELDVELHHCLGETDDHTWTWLPDHDMICAGDQFIWNFPNCGNPQKVQRYPVEWAESLRAMAALDAELFVPAHGLPITGRDRIRQCLEIVATTLETLVSQVIEAMNSGAALDDIVQSVSVPADTLALPYLRPLYDEPEFVIRNIWRLYGGWWDGNPARLKPPSDHAIGLELVALAGGTDPLIERALELSSTGEHRVACQLIELAVAAEPESHAVHEARSAIYGARRGAESSLMAKGIFLSAKADSDAVVTGEVPNTNMVLNLGD